LFAEDWPPAGGVAAYRQRKIDNNMCGLAGFWGGHLSEADMATQLLRMTDAIAHRGPDAQDRWLDHSVAIALGHRRLAIVELSPAGAQPMVSCSGRYVLTFNGEIYNHLELRDDSMVVSLGVCWRGMSDTETLVNGFEAWGIAGALERMVGMFAFAVWDRELRVLTLGRDRFGEKPLYYGVTGMGASAAFLFASELGSFDAYRGFHGEVDRDSLCMFMRHGNVGGDRTIYRGIHKLLPGHLLTLSGPRAQPAIESYWSLARIVERGVAQPFQGSETEAVEALDHIARRAVRQQMAADVPLGAFLSGGVDSSMVVALMQAQSQRRIQTFTIGFDDASYNEANHAKAVAHHLGTDHTELYVTPREATDTIAMLPRLYGEPFADSSQIPTYLVSQLARRDVAVSLSGDAGDEVFGGYNRYQVTARLWGRLSTVPVPMRRAMAHLLLRMPPHRLDQMASRVPGLGRWPDLGGTIHKGARVMAASSAADLYRGLVSQWSDPADVVLDCQEPASFLTGLRPAFHGLNDVEQMMALDTLTYLPDDILTKVDRAAMSVGLETRVPLLDHRLVEFAWQLPLHYKIRRGSEGTTTKWIMRELLFKHVPRALIERPKQGFGIPIGTWLRGPLRSWAESLLGESRLRSEGFFNVAAVRRKWSEHLSGRKNWQHQLWCVLMFQAWLEEHAKPLQIL
jgi:asparagine synthase (glutamine-hydrolysing)